MLAWLLVTVAFIAFSECRDQRAETAWVREITPVLIAAIEDQHRLLDSLPDCSVAREVVSCVDGREMTLDDLWQSRESVIEQYKLELLATSTEIQNMLARHSKTGGGLWNELIGNQQNTMGNVETLFLFRNDRLFRAMVVELRESLSTDHWPESYGITIPPPAP